MIPSMAAIMNYFVLIILLSPPWMKSFHHGRPSAAKPQPNLENPQITQMGADFRYSSSALIGVYLRIS
jgi:hypothetical protein